MDADTLRLINHTLLIVLLMMLVVNGVLLWNIRSLQREVRQRLDEARTLNTAAKVLVVALQGKHADWDAQHPTPQKDACGDPRTTLH